MSDPEDRIARFEQLNALGKAVYLGGSTVRLMANLIDAALVRAADVVVEAEQAFRRELDPNIEDAKILEEYRGDREPRAHS